MLVLQGLGLLLFLVAALILAATFIRGSFLRRLLFGKLPADKFADAVHQVMRKVTPNPALVSLASMCTQVSLSWLQP